jgi:hypothetical protein
MRKVWGLRIRKLPSLGCVNYKAGWIRRFIEIDLL